MKIVKPSGWMLTSSAAYPVMKHHIRPFSLTTSFHSLVHDAMRLRAFTMVSLSSVNFSVNKFTLGFLSFSLWQREE
jgi:hypothetical protein